MIWDRFDDAHDDLPKDINRRRRQVGVLQERLRKAAISYKPFVDPEPHNEPGPQGWYDDTGRVETAVIAYETYLKELVERAAL